MDDGFSQPNKLTALLYRGVPLSPTVELPKQLFNVGNLWMMDLGNLIS
ncbi:hypothetical protein PITCH_A1710004 [uncultured Desulfobacterium sp.]|uniref:Uncharacterized protein n=1 Tax=uncultured Desulfobacterium sp. TaxID=201089 RepID=A0A445MUK8_9BACT|nr:hypothetical protein PITCH_A1710004 [uncultured Desulfobacterium sp.]